MEKSKNLLTNPPCKNIILKDILFVYTQISFKHHEIQLVRNLLVQFNGFSRLL